MKRKKFIALLCVAATSASLVTPVMAEENQAVETVRETAVEQETAGQETTKQEAPAGEVPVEEGAEEKRSTCGGGRRTGRRGCTCSGRVNSRKSRE